MAPPPIDLEGRLADEEAEEAMREKLEKRFERIGEQIMHRTDPGGRRCLRRRHDRRPFNRRDARRSILGQAYFQAFNAMRQNRAALERIADVLVERRELHGDEVVDLLDEVGPTKATIDLLDEDSWPKL